MTRPTFEHPIFERLYERDYFIDDAVLREILALGPEAAVPELLKIANTTLDDFVAGKLAQANWWSTYHLHHALYLLHELRAPEAYAVYCRLLRLDADSTDYWFGDYLFEEVPEMLAQAAQTRLPELLALLEDPEILLMHRLVVSETISRLVRQQPEVRAAVVAYLQPHLRRIIADPTQARQLFPADTGVYHYDLEDYLAGILVDMQEAGLHELEPEMRELHRLGLVDEGMAGSAEDIRFETPQPLKPSPDIFARYQHMRDLPDNHSPYHPDAAAIARRRAEQEAHYEQLRREAFARQQPRQVLPKTGRNDPCPCGSGKKYKKCHGA